MSSNNLIGFGTWRKELFSCKLFIYLLWKSYSKYSDEKEKSRNTLVTAKCPLCMPEGHFVLYAGNIIIDIVVLDNGHSNRCINMFSCYHSMFKRCALLSQQCLSSGLIYVSEIVYVRNSGPESYDYTVDGNCSLLDENNCILEVCIYDIFCCYI